jgi:hypothetical protein
MQTIYLDPRDVPQHLRGAYAGKKFQAIVTTEVQIPSDAGLWADGSRDLYSAIELTSGSGRMLPGQDAAPWDGKRTGCTIPLTPGFSIIRHTVSQGHDLGLTFFVHPDNAAALLPAQSSELSDHEKAVLRIIRGYKSAFRKDEAQRQGIRANWETILSSLKASGYVDSRGAITVKGKNAI